LTQHLVGATASVAAACVAASVSATVNKAINKIAKNPFIFFIN